MKKISIITIVFLILITTSACQQKKPQNNQVTEVNKILTSITVEAIKNQNFGQAQKSINALILSDQDNVWSFIQSAIISLPAIVSKEIIDNMLSKQSIQNSSSKMFGISKIYITYKETELALKAVNKSIELDKNNLDAIFWRARLLSVLKQFNKSEKDFEYIIKKSPNNEKYTNQYASLLQETKQFDKAQAVLAKHKATPDLLFKRIIYALQNDNKEIANSVYPQLKNLIVTEDQENHKNFLTAESAYWLKNDIDSEEYYRKVLGGDNYMNARDMLSLILFEKEKYNDSIEILHQLQNGEEKYAVKAYRLESRIYTKLGKPDESIKTLSRSLKILPNNPDLLYDRAMLYESQGKMAKVEKDLLQIIKDDPNNHEALNALGYSLVDHDLQLEKAYKYIQKALSLSPENPAVIDSLGWAQYKLGKYQEAEESFLKALDLDINDPELYIHLYKTQLKLNKIDQAKQTLDKAIELFPENENIQKL